MDYKGGQHRGKEDKTSRLEYHDEAVCEMLIPESPPLTVNETEQPFQGWTRRMVILRDLHPHMHVQHARLLLSGVKPWVYLQTYFFFGCKIIFP